MKACSYSVRMNTMTIDPQALNDLSQRAEVEIIDVRSPAEYRSLHIPDALLSPLDMLDPAAIMKSRKLSSDAPLFIACQAGTRALFIACQAGTRAKKAQDIFKKAGFENCCVIEGGIAAWAAKGLPVNKGKSVIPVDRQTRIVVGTMILIGLALGYFVNPAFLLLSAIGGCGMIYAGITDLCPLADMIAKLPWNK